MSRLQVYTVWNVFLFLWLSTTPGQRGSWNWGGLAFALAMNAFIIWVQPVKKEKS